MAMWDVDLTTRMGAQTATRMGAVAAFTFAGMGMLGVAFYGFIAMKTNPAVAAGAVFGGLLEAVIGLIAGFRLRAGKRLFWGGFTVVLVLLEQIGKLVQLQVGGFVIGIVVLIYLVNGVRGAHALRRSGFAEDEAEAFA